MPTDAIEIMLPLVYQLLDYNRVALVKKMEDRNSEKARAQSKDYDKHVLYKAHLTTSD